VELKMRIASWNVNSVRARLEHVERWLDAHDPDVLCLQETKVVDEEFPLASFARRGYEAAFFGQRTYNGVALLARHPLSDVRRGFGGGPEDPQRRLLSATVRGVRIFSAYVPNGQALDAPAFAYKLDWLARLGRDLEADASRYPAVVLCGDFNVARDERDVYDAEALAGQLHFSEAERDALEATLRAGGLFDALREVTGEAGLFSWWDYRMNAFRRNRGLRIDYAFLSAGLRPLIRDCRIDREARGWEKTSDHAPVVVDFDEP
jgi:exodeoxyribonuclease-3